MFVICSIHYKHIFVTSWYQLEKNSPLSFIYMTHCYIWVWVHQALTAHGFWDCRHCATDNVRGLLKGLTTCVQFSDNTSVGPLQMIVCCHCLSCCQLFTSKKISLAVAWKFLQWLPLGYPDGITTWRCLGRLLLSKFILAAFSLSWQHKINIKIILRLVRSHAKDNVLAVSWCYSWCYLYVLTLLGVRRHWTAKVLWFLPGR